MKKYTFHVSGTHCASCKILIEDVLKEQDSVSNVHVDLKKEIIEVETSVDQDPAEFAKILSSKIEPNGYTLSFEKIIKEKKTDNIIWQAIPIGLLFLILFFLLQKSGILNLGIGGQMTPVTSFMIGLIASLSSCLAIVGGLVLSLSAKFAQDEGGVAKKPMMLFHLGRLVSFALLGGVLGFVGKTIGINFIISQVLGLIASFVMVLLGFNLLGVFVKNKLTLPSHIF
jgi:copper chaperone CopZ